MDLRFPSGSEGLFASWTRDAGEPGGDASVPASAAALEELLAALQRGWIEYLGVHDGQVFLQIAGDGDVPHPGIGRARRMQVPSPERQHAVMIEAVAC